ncbi:MAG: chorismate mutase [Candidatus Marinimicrobia bacterium]|nr:chorismate mutase [Candidatus Neomarinimicrobiota bacterium]
MDKRLKNLRQNIDDIDEKILNLLENRMRIVREVGELKQELDISVEDLNRETEIIQRLTQYSSGKLSENQLIRIFTAVFKSSKQIQRKDK